MGAEVNEEDIEAIEQRRGRVEVGIEEGDVEEDWMEDEEPRDVLLRLLLMMMVGGELDFVVEIDIMGNLDERHRPEWSRGLPWTGGVGDWQAINTYSERRIQPHVDRTRYKSILSN